MVRCGNRTRALSTRGRFVVLSSGLLGLAVLAIAGIAFRDRIREEYWLWRLDRGNDHQRQAAARHLGELRSLPAVPGLLRWVTSPGAGEGSGAESEVIVDLGKGKVFAIHDFGDGFCTHRECPYRVDGCLADWILQLIVRTTGPAAWSTSTIEYYKGQVLLEGYRNEHAMAERIRAKLRIARTALISMGPEAVARITDLLSDPSLDESTLGLGRLMLAELTLIHGMAPAPALEQVRR